MKRGFKNPLNLITIKVINSIIMFKFIKNKWKKLKEFEFEYEVDIYIPPYIVVSIIMLIICIVWIIFK